MYVRFACKYVSELMHAEFHWTLVERPPDPLEIEFYTVASHHVGTGNQIPVLGRVPSALNCRAICSHLLSLILVPMSITNTWAHTCPSPTRMCTHAHTTLYTHQPSRPLRLSLCPREFEPKKHMCLPGQPGNMVMYGAESA